MVLYKSVPQTVTSLYVPLGHFSVNFTTAPKSPWEFKHPTDSHIQQIRKELPFGETDHLALPTPRF